MVTEPPAEDPINRISDSTIENVVQARDISGGIHFHRTERSRPVAGAEYLRQVRKLAPRVLEGREDELAALAQFATAADPSPWYQWWRAPAWAGKSALLASFVVNPPDGVRIVSFFVNARQRGEDDRAGYISTLRLEETARNIADPFMRGHAVDDVAGAIAVAGYLDRAQRIACTLSNPAHQVRAMGFIATSLARAGNTGLLLSVIEQINTMAVHDAAHVERVRALAETVVALSAQQGHSGIVAVLVGQLEEIADDSEHSFARQEALVILMPALAVSRDPERADRLAATMVQAGGYRSALASMAENAAATGDIAHSFRWIGKVRNPSSYELSRVAMALVTAGEPDWAVRLADSTVKSAERPEMLADIAVALAETGNLDRAHRLLARIKKLLPASSTEKGKDAALAAALEEIAHAGDLAAARLVMDLIADRDQQDKALRSLARIVAERGEPDLAEVMVRDISTLRGRADALTAVAFAVEATYERAGTEDTLLDDGRHADIRASELAELVDAQVRKGQLDRTTDLVSTAEKVFGSAGSGDTAALTELVRAASGVVAQSVVRQWIARIEQLIATLAEDYSQVRALAELAQAAAGLTDPHPARRLAARADELLRTLDKGVRDFVVTAVTTALVSVGELDRAEVVARMTASARQRGGNLAKVAAHVQPQRGKRLVIEIVRMTDWTVPMIVPVWHETAVLQALKVELDGIRG